MFSCFLLPWPPTVNSMFGQKPGRKRYQSKKYKDWIDGALAAVRRQKVEENYTGNVAVTLRMGAPDKRKRDLDNYVKPILDLITKTDIWADDSQVTWLLVLWDSDIKNGVQIEIVEAP